MYERIRARWLAALGIIIAVLLAFASGPQSTFAESASPATPKSVNTEASLPPAPPEAAGGAVDFSQGGWVRRRIEAVAMLFECDFVLNEACVYSKDSGKLTLVYATRSSIADVRAYFMALMKDSVETGVNDAGNLSLSGTAGGEALKVRNYYSEVTNLIELTLTEDDAALLNAVRSGFPEAVFAANGAFSQALKGASDSGYVLYTYDEYDDRFIPGAPVFSRAYNVERAVEAVDVEDQGALLAMEPAQADGRNVAVLLYQMGSPS